jgi:exodeoxyribonuclease VII large subunit
LSYHGVLQRGYALVRDDAGRTLRSAAQATAGKALDIELADGRFGALVEGRRRTPLATRPRRRTAAKGDDQGSLF